MPLSDDGAEALQAFFVDELPSCPREAVATPLLELVPGGQERGAQSALERFWLERKDARADVVLKHLVTYRDISRRDCEDRKTNRNVVCQFSRKTVAHKESGIGIEAVGEQSQVVFSQYIEQGIVV